jgi:hypothetical protein
MKTYKMRSMLSAARAWQPSGYADADADAT